MTTATATETSAAPKAERIVLPVNNQPAVFESLLIFKAEATMNEFGQQFDALRQQFGRLQGIAQRRDQALTTGEKDALNKVLEQEARDLDAKDSLFQKVYGFRVVALGNRPIKIQQTHKLHIALSDEELAKAKQEKDFKEEMVSTIEGQKYVHIRTIGGLAYDEFIRNYQVISAKRTNFVNFKAAAEKATGEEKTRIEKFLKDAEAELLKDNELMFKTYGFTLSHNFRLTFEDAKFFVMLVEEEVKRLQASAAAPAEAAKKPAAAPTEKAKN